MKTKISVPRAKNILRELGAQDLASALGRASKGRNSAAHPDWWLLNKVKALRGGVAGEVAGSLGCEHYDISSKEGNAETEASEGASPESVGMVEEAGAPVAAKTISQWADMFSSDSGSDDREETSAPQCKSANTDWLEPASQRECCEVRKFVKIFGSKGTQQPNVDSTLEWLPKSLLDTGTALADDDKDDDEDNHGDISESGEEDAVLGSFADALCDYVIDGKRDSATGVKHAFGIFVSARIAEGDCRKKAVAEGKLVLKSLIEAKKYLS